MNTSLQHALWTVRIRLETGGNVVQVLKPLNRKKGEPKIKKGSKDWKHQQLHALLVRSLHSDYYTNYFKDAYAKIPSEFIAMVQADYRETVQWQIQHIAEDGTVLSESDWIGMEDLARKNALNEEPFTIRNLVEPEKQVSTVELIEDFDFGFMAQPTKKATAKTSKA